MVRSSSFIATPPGATIKEQLNDREMSQKEFAARMDMSEKHISKLVNGEVQLTPEVAVRLEVVLGAPARFWTGLEAIYREKLIRVRIEQAMEADEILVKQLPYNEMAKLGWVPMTRESREKVINLRKFFEVVNLSLLENSQITRIACRRLAVTEKGDFALMAWAQKAKLEARNMQTLPINLKRLFGVIPQLREMTALQPEEFCPRIKSLLADCGIALVFLPHLKGSFLQGASFMDGGKVVIGLTTRGKDADKFWFSLFHELAHVVLGHIDQENGTSDADERNADAWARDALIPLDVFEDFREIKTYTAAAVCDFAKKQGIAPGIVVGRLQNEGLIKHSMMNELKEQYEIAI